ncbi:cell wall-binding repeat-containing protein [Mobiluncus sp.]|uniref:cell wall-binding repeat-containing protein n=1 Tax=Mobiluncus sp. TaxID=47293 RepID=UPI002A91FABF|nr:cell wall-binding repeat-containing protein [Mobiluncus sp.]MDY6076273.1 cell wall-binding repeat-containing protein [Mobiluncus sp.]
MKVSGKVIALGGPGAVSAEVLAEIAQGADTDRLQGENRYATSLAIANYAFPGHKGNFYVARGDVLADSVSRGSAPGRSHHPVLHHAEPGNEYRRWLRAK